MNAATIAPQQQGTLISGASCNRSPGELTTVGETPGQGQHPSRCPQLLGGPTPATPDPTPATPPGWGPKTAASRVLLG